MADDRWALRWVVVALLACLFAVDPGGLSPSGPARFAALAAVVGAGLAVVVRNPRRRPPAQLRPFVWLWLILLVLIGLSVVAGVDRWHGIFGTPERNLGLLTWIGFAAAFWIGTALPIRSARHLATVSTVAVSATSGLALLERLGFDPTDTAWPGDRVGAPFAQSTYLAVALVVLVPPVAAMALDSGGGNLRRSVGGVVAVAGLTTLLATESRGPVLALGLALMIVLALRGRPLVGAATGVAATMVVIAVSTTRGWGSFGGRLDEWRIGLRGVREQPLLGFGPEGYRHRFPSLVDAAYVRANGSSVITDRAHNVWIDTALSSGVLAGFALLGLWFLVGRSAFRTMTDPSVSASRLGLAVAVVAGFLQQMVLFPLAELDPLLWLFAGVVVGGTLTEPTPSDIVAPADRPVGRSAPLVRLAAGVGIVAMASSFWWNVTGAVGEHRLAQSRTFRQDQAEAVADEALALRPQSVRLAYAAAIVHRDGPTLLDLDEAIVIIEDALTQHPDDPALRMALVFDLVERANRSGLSSDVERAIEAADAAVVWAPHSPSLLGAHAEALLLDGQHEFARRQVDRALDLDPDDVALRTLADSIEKS